jgi:signal transduction histidine kinase
MGRLFWKFFLFLCLGQILTAFAVGIVIVLTKHAPDQQRLDMSNTPPPMLNQTPRPPAPENVFGMAGAPPRLEQTEPPGPIRPEMEAPDGPPPAPMVSPPPGERNSILPPLLPLLVGSLISLVIAALLAWYFSRPIRNLREAFELVAKGKLDTRIGQTIVGHNDELYDLSHGFDSMTNRLQNLVEGQQRLLHDVSHELRSPLARLQAALDLIQQQPDRAIEFIERLERESKRMDRLIEELLTYARLDAGLPGNSELEIDISELIDTIAEDASFEARKKYCKVDVSKAQNLYVSCNPNLMHRAIENIVRNAIRHTPDGTKVTIACASNNEANRVFITIKDQGGGMPENELQSVFEPFFRGETAGRYKGYGLGMAITHRIVKAHRGIVRAENTQDEGLLVTIELPMVKHVLDELDATIEE